MVPHLDDSPLAATVAINTKAYDTSSVTGTASGGGASSVTYFMAGPFTAAADASFTCASGTQIGSGAVGSNSNVVTFTDAGIYEFWAEYSGNANNDPSKSTCGTERVTVNTMSVSPVLPWLPLAPVYPVFPVLP